MLRRPIACGLLVWYLGACTTWAVEKGVSPTQLIATAHPSAIRLTRADGSQLVLHQPRVDVGDSLAGVHDGGPFSVAVSDVTGVEIRKISADKTIGLALGISAGAAFIALIATMDPFGGPIAFGFPQ
jgi:hypothetical protein